jgi:ABC-2 type transport system ATP-binding protein
LSRIRDFQREGRTIVFVTHAVDLVREICTKAYFLHKGELAATGRPSDVVDTFRRTVHGANLDVTAVDDRGTGEARITEVRFIGSNGEERQVYEPGEPLEIRARIAVREPIDDPVLGCIVYDDSGRYLWGTNTAMRDVSVGRLPAGETIVRWKIPSLPVVNTTCAVTLAVSSKNGQDYHWREKGWAFKVVSKGADLGRVHFDVQLEVEQA